MSEEIKFEEIKFAGVRDMVETIIEWALSSQEAEGLGGGESFEAILEQYVWVKLMDIKEDDEDVTDEEVAAVIARLPKLTN